MHFFHLNINSVLPKIDKEIQISGYILDRDRKGGVAYYVRSDLSYDVRHTFSDEIESIFVDNAPQNKTHFSGSSILTP